MLTHESFLLGPQNKFIFVFIPKVACTGWKMIMRYLHGYRDYLNPNMAHLEGEGGVPSMSSLKDPYKILLNSSIPKYTCVRNPFVRLLSAYLNKIERFYVDPDALYFESFGKVFDEIEGFRLSCFPKKDKIDFEVFIYWLEFSDHYSWFANNLHWRPQSQIIGSGQVEYDFIARFENLKDDAKAILDAIGCDISFPTQMESKFSPTYAKDKIKMYYTPDLERRVVNMYKNDFELFKYETSISKL